MTLLSKGRRARKTSWHCFSYNRLLRVCIKYPKPSVTMSQNQAQLHPHNNKQLSQEYTEIKCIKNMTIVIKKMLLIFCLKYSCASKAPGRHKRGLRIEVYHSSVAQPLSTVQRGFSKAIYSLESCFLFQRNNALFSWTWNNSEKILKQKTHTTSQKKRAATESLWTLIAFTDISDYITSHCSDAKRW